jgi:outer membrane protein assembly factor BamE (lipoprotein component of BamABCDE complex)
MNSLKRLTTTALIRAFLVSVVFASPVYAGTEVTAARSQVATDDTVQAIKPGMTAQEVLVKIGPPQGKMRFERSHTTAWDYAYRDTFGYFGEFSVILDDKDVVVSRIALRKDS